jgi:MFS family permease
MSFFRSVKLRGNIVYLAAVSALWGATNQMRLVIWQPFLLGLGLTLSSLGIIGSLISLIKILVQPIVGSLSDAWGRKPFIVLRYALAVLSGLLFTITHSWTLLIVGVILISLSQTLMPIWNSLVAESVSSSEVGFTFSLVETAGMAVGLVGSIVSGVLATKYGFSAAFIAISALGFFSVFLVLLGVEETRIRDANRSLTPKDFVRSVSSALNPPVKLKGFYLAMGVDMFAWSLGGGFLSGILVRDFGYSPYMLGVLSAVTIGTITLTQVPLGRFIDRFPYGRVMAFAQLLGCLNLGLVLLTRRFEVLILGRILIGVSSAIWVPSNQAWLALNVDEDDRAGQMGSFNTFKDLLGLPAPIIGGLLFDFFGFYVPLLLNLCFALFDAYLLLRLISTGE